jgi:hypothetical protein
MRHLVPYKSQAKKEIFQFSISDKLQRRTVQLGIIQLVRAFYRRRSRRGTVRRLTLSRAQSKSNGGVFRRDYFPAALRSAALMRSCQPGPSS